MMDEFPPPLVLRTNHLRAAWMEVEHAIGFPIQSSSRLIFSNDDTADGAAAQASTGAWHARVWAIAEAWATAGVSLHLLECLRQAFFFGPNAVIAPWNGLVGARKNVSLVVRCTQSYFCLFFRAHFELP